MYFLTNIPLAIINNIGFAAILFLVYQVVKSLQEKEILPIKAAHLFNLASIFQALGLVQFIGLLFYPKLSSDILNNGLDFVNAGISSLFMKAPIEWLSIIGFVYCIVLVGLIIKTGFQFYQLTTLIKKANFSESDKYTSFISSLPHYTLGRKVKLGISSTIETPISLGWIEPIILLPIALVNQLSIKEIESIILHEWAHILRNDYLINLMTSFVQVILFFNPFTRGNLKIRVTKLLNQSSQALFRISIFIKTLCPKTVAICFDFSAFTFTAVNDEFRSIGFVNSREVEVESVFHIIIRKHGSAHKKSHYRFRCIQPIPHMTLLTFVQGVTKSLLHQEPHFLPKGGTHQQKKQSYDNYQFWQ